MLRLALVRLGALADAFGELVTGFVDDGVFHAALLAALSATGSADLLALATRRDGVLLPSARLYDHFQTHRWRVHQLSHTVHVAVREAPRARADGIADEGLSGTVAPRKPHGLGAPGTAGLIASLDQRGALHARPSQSRAAVVAALGAARATAARARTPQAAARAATHVRAATRVFHAGMPIVSDGARAAELLNVGASPTRLDQLPALRARPSTSGSGAPLGAPPLSVLRASGRGGEGLASLGKPPGVAPNADAALLAAESRAATAGVVTPERSGRSAEGDTIPAVSRAAASATAGVIVVPSQRSAGPSQKYER